MSETTNDTEQTDEETDEETDEQRIGEHIERGTTSELFNGMESVVSPNNDTYSVKSVYEDVGGATRVHLYCRAKSRSCYLLTRKLAEEIHDGDWSRSESLWS